MRLCRASGTKKFRIESSAHKYVIGIGPLEKIGQARVHDLRAASR